MKRISICIISIVLLSLLFSCQDDKIANPNGNTNIPTDGITNINDLIGSYMNEPNLVGLIEFNSEKRNDLSYTGYPDGSKKYHENDVIDNYAYAGFRYNNEPVTLEKILINTSLLREYADGAYAKTGSDEMDLYFDGGTPNKYYLECLNNSVIPDSVFDEVAFANRIELTNISRYDSIHVNDINGWEINWTGGSSNGKVAIHINIFDPFVPDSGKSSGTYILTENSGSYTFSKEHLSYIGPLDEYYNITIENYEPIFRTLSNGNKICLLGLSSYRTTVILTE